MLVNHGNSISYKHFPSVSQHCYRFTGLLLEKHALFRCIRISLVKCTKDSLIPKHNTFENTIFSGSQVRCLGNANAFVSQVKCWWITSVFFLTSSSHVKKKLYEFTSNSLVKVNHTVCISQVGHLRNYSFSVSQAKTREVMEFLFKLLVNPGGFILQNILLVRNTNILRVK